MAAPRLSCLGLAGQACWGLGDPARREEQGMDLKDLLAAFTIVFLAELGDKTQLSVLLFASKSGHSGFPWDVCTGACLALIAATVIATVLGYLGKAVVPVKVLHYVAAAGFVAIGIWLLVSKS
jgi:putative Ca2+/H+ antiporter (TMEM165/GDT1 family)